MKHSRRSDITIDGINHGFGLDASIKLRQATDHTPKTQIWSSEADEENLPVEKRRHYCAMCRGPLDYLVGSKTIWHCDNCQEYYDTAIQDRPIKNISKFRARPHSSIQLYPTPDDEDAPFVSAIDLNVDTDIENRSYENNRIQRLHVKGSFADAVLAGALSAKDEDED